MWEAFVKVFYILWSLGGLRGRLFLTFFKVSRYYGTSEGVYYGDLVSIGAMTGKALVSDKIIMAFRSAELHM